MKLNKELLLISSLLILLFLTSCEVQQVQNQIIQEAQNTKVTERLTPIKWEYDYNWYDGYPKLKVEYQHDSLKFGEHGSAILNIVPITVDRVNISVRILECDGLEGSSELEGIRDFCINPLGLKRAGFEDKDVYMIVRRAGSYNSYDFDEIEGKSIDDLKKLSSITVYEQHIPHVDEKGFVPIEYVDETWCNYYVSKKYPDECKKFIEEMKNPDCSLDKFEYVCDYLVSLVKDKATTIIKTVIKTKKILQISGWKERYDECVQELGKSEYGLDEIYPTNKDEKVSYYCSYYTDKNVIWK